MMHRVDGEQRSWCWATAAYGTTSVWFLQDQINKEDCFAGINGEDMATSMIGITCKCLSEFKGTNKASVRSLTCWEKHPHAALNSTFTVSKKGHSSIKNHTHFGFSLKKAQMSWHNLDSVSLSSRGGERKPLCIHLLTARTATCS